MSLFDWLLVGHLVGDFLLQTDKMAQYKARDWRWLMWHVAWYMAAVALATLLYALQHPVLPGPVIVGLAIVAFTHIELDRRSFTAWWMRFVGITQAQPWLSIVVDQVFHLLVLVLVAHVMLAGNPGNM